MPIKCSTYWFLCLGVFIILSKPAFAADYFRDNYRDTRMLGRGNAGIADVTGGAAAFYNPAGLADSKSFSFVPVDLTFGGNQNIYDSIQEFSSLTSADQTLGQKFSPFLGKPLSLQGSYFPHIAIPGAMIGIYNYLDMNVQYRDPVFPRLELDARHDWGVVLGGGRQIVPNLYFGASLRYMRRKSLEETINMASAFDYSASYLQDLIRKGEIWTVNLGLRYKHLFQGDKMWMAGGLVVEDLGYPQFKNDKRAALPSRQAQKINLGVGYGVVASSLVQVKVLFDLKEINQTEKSYTKRIFTGTEVGLPGFVLRAGLFQGYWTLGVTTQIIPAIDLDIVSYGEELASAAGIKESRYWMLGIRMGIDAQGKTKKKQKFTLDHL